MWVENDEIWKFRKMKNEGGVFTHNDEEWLMSFKIGMGDGVCHFIP